MPVHNADIAAIFDEIADLLEIQGENPFRIRAYRNAARTLKTLTHDASSLIRQGEDLTRLPGIGKDLTEKIKEIVTTGECQALLKLRRQISPAVAELMKIPGLGPKRVRLLYETLGVRTPRELRQAAEKHLVRDLPGFGDKLEQRILEALHRRQPVSRRLELAVAAQYAEGLVAFLKGISGVKEVVVAGSFRRCKETVGDLDILVTATRGQAVTAQLVSYDEVAEVLSQGSTRASVVLRSGLQVDVRVVAQSSFGAALHYFTGSRAHNIAIRRLGQQRGLKINEYGVFRGAQRIAGETEQSVFEAVGLPWIVPELREARGEIEAAREGRLPHLIERRDLRGDLHAHTRATDGRDSLKEMALAAKACGLTYLAITEHSQRLTVAHGLDEKGLRRHIEAIDRLNEQLSGMTLLKGIEVEILEDGRLDLPERILLELDLVVGAVHSHFNLTREKQTQRLLRAMDHRCFALLAHPTGRLLGERPAYEVDMERVIAHARQRGCFLELNAQPKRLDLTDDHCRMAKEAGVLVSINSDAHSTLDFANLRYGIGQARRGWLEPADVLNTRTLPQLHKLLQSLR